MSKISNDGLQQIQIIKNALDSMYDKLDKEVFIPRKKTSKNIIIVVVAVLAVLILLGFFGLMGKYYK